MKRPYATLPIMAACALLSCEQQIVEDVKCNISLDPSNTYYAGEPVRFVMDGNADNVVFYSGETGAQYQYKDRYAVSIDQINSATLAMEYQARYGYAGGLDIYVSNTFEGLKGDDGAADRATVKAMYEGGMQGWTKLDYEEGASTKWTSQSYDINTMLDNFCLAIHWHPIRDGKSAQRTYYVNGDITLDMAGSAPSLMSIATLNPVVVMMNEELDPYHKNKGNGSVRFDNPKTADICFQGAGAKVLDYALDGWMFTTPSALNKVDNDKGVVVKNLQNYMDSYEYVYDEPGNYSATFVCRNSNYKGESEVVRTVTFSIIEKP